MTDSDHRPESDVQHGAEREVRNGIRPRHERAEDIHRPDDKENDDE